MLIKRNNNIPEGHRPMWIYTMYAGMSTGKYIDMTKYSLSLKNAHFQHEFKMNMSLPLIDCCIFSFVLDNNCVQWFGCFNSGIGKETHYYTSEA